MSFAENYARSVNSSNLMDDEHHHMTQALCAAAMADQTGGIDMLGSLLSRVKYADGMARNDFEAGSKNFAQLLRIWHNTVIQKGIDRKWMKIEAPWDITAAHVLYKRVAESSLAHWLDGKCPTCKGPGVDENRRICEECNGSGEAKLSGGEFEKGKALEMVSELEGLMQAHNARAAKLLRRF